MATGQLAAKWQKFQLDKDALPFLTYSTVGDARVRDSHRALDGITKHIDDPFWDVHFPPNGWRCRCNVIQSLGPEEDNGLRTSEAQHPPAFRHNAGKDGQFWADDTEPYRPKTISGRSEARDAAYAALPPAPFPKETHYRTVDELPKGKGDKLGHSIRGEVQRLKSKVSGVLDKVRMRLGARHFAMHRGHNMTPDSVKDEFPIAHDMMAHGFDGELLEEYGDGSKVEWDYRARQPGREPILFGLKNIRSHRSATVFSSLAKAWKQKTLPSTLMRVAQVDQEVIDGLNGYFTKFPGAKIDRLWLLDHDGKLYRLTGDQVRARDWDALKPEEPSIR